MKHTDGKQQSQNAQKIPVSTQHVFFIDAMEVLNKVDCLKSYMISVTFLC